MTTVPLKFSAESPLEVAQDPMGAVSVRHETPIATNTFQLLYHPQSQLVFSYILYHGTKPSSLFLLHSNVLSTEVK